MPLGQNLVFIAFSDTHGKAENLAKLYTLIKDTINSDRVKNSKVQHILLVPGDVFGVSALWSAVSEGQFDIDAISKIAELFPEGHRFFTPGNHDFYYGEEKLIALIDKAKFRVVISNTKFKENSKLQFESLATLTVGSEELTIGGLMTPETLNADGAKEVIKDAKSIDLHPEFKNLPDILLSHLGSATDKTLPYETTIVGGHTHDAQVNEAHDGNSFVVNTGAGECIVVLRDAGKKAQLLFSNNCPPSPKILGLINDCATQHQIDLNELEQAVFTIAPDSDKPSGLELPIKEIQNTKSHLRISDSFITRYTADAIAESLRKKNENEALDFVLYPAASIRSNFLPGQAVTGIHLFETYYYSAKLVKMALTGSELVHLLAFGVMQGYKCCENRGQLLAPSEGLTYAYDISQENPGDTISWVKKGAAYINPAEIFNIVTTNWIANDMKILYPDISMEEYSDVPKIYQMVIKKEHQGNVYESFGERIFPKQSLLEQAVLAQQRGNSRADKPGFDRYTIKINFNQHQDNFDQEQQSSKSLSYTQTSNLFFFNSGSSQPPPEAENVLESRYYSK